MQFDRSRLNEAQRNSFDLLVSKGFEVLMYPDAYEATAPQNQQTSQDIFLVDPSYRPPYPVPFNTKKARLHPNGSFTLYVLRHIDQIELRKAWCDFGTYNNESDFVRALEFVSRLKDQESQ